jgi:AraC family ethanolamine operon transcriptional activator
VLPAVSSGRIRVDEFDALREVGPRWDQEYAQLGRGAPSAKLSFVNTPSMELAVVSRAPGVLFQGAPPPGMAVVAVNLRGLSLHLQRHPWGRDLLGVVPRGGEFEIISTTPHTLFGLCVDQDRLDDAALTHWGRRFTAGHLGPGMRFRDPANRRGLIRTWARWVNLARRQPGMFTDPGLVALMEKEVIGAVMEGVVPAFPTAPLRPRRELALRAEAFLRGSLDEPVRIEDVCSAVHASRPALHRAFQAAFGTSPMAYLKSLRLSAAHKELTRARQCTTVAAVAMRWGFFRLGCFSADYRAMFGEKPSETLGRARGRSTVDARSRLPVAGPLLVAGEPPWASCDLPSRPAIPGATPLERVHEEA